MPVEEGATCCACGQEITGRRLGWLFDGYMFKAHEVHGHKFCAEHECNREAWSELARKRTAACKCKSAIQGSLRSACTPTSEKRSPGTPAALRSR